MSRHTPDDHFRFKTVFADGRVTYRQSTLATAKAVAARMAKGGRVSLFQHITDEGFVRLGSRSAEGVWNVREPQMDLIAGHRVGDLVECGSTAHTREIAPMQNWHPSHFRFNAKTDEEFVGEPGKGTVFVPILNGNVGIGIIADRHRTSRVY